MPQGLQIWDASSNLILDPSTRLGKVLGYIDAAAGTGLSGSDTNAGLLLGTPWWTEIPFSAVSGYPNAYDQGAAGALTVSVSTSTISWSYTGVVGFARRIIYGVY